jgi:transcriptional regulator with XRE-family HTH domain
MMVPKRLKEARKRANLSQEGLLQLADMETVSNKSQVSSYESGRYSPPFEFIVQIAKALDYPEAYFYTADDVFADTILQIHRNKNDPRFNPYITELNILKQRLQEAQKAASSLAELLKK